MLKLTKFLQVLGVYEWAGCNPLPPEFWLVPRKFPIHPGMLELISFYRKEIIFS